MFFDKKVWNDFEKEIEKWENEEELDNTFKLVIEKSTSDRLKVAAQIIATVIQDEMLETGDTRFKATDTILTFLCSNVKKLIDSY